MCWSVVFFSLVYGGKKKIGKRKWGRSYFNHKEGCSSTTGTWRLLYWRQAHCGTECGFVNLKLHLFEFIPYVASDTYVWSVAVLISWCKEIWSRLVYLPLYISLGAESPRLPCWVPDQLQWTADSDCSLYGSGVLKIGLKGIFFRLCNAFSFNLTLPNSYLLAVSIFRVLSLPVYVSARVLDSYCSLKVDCNSILSNISTRLAKLVQVKLYIACIYRTLRIWVFLWDILSISALAMGSKE